MVILTKISVHVAWNSTDSAAIAVVTDAAALGVSLVTLVSTVEKRKSEE